LIEGFSKVEHFRFLPPIDIDKLNMPQKEKQQLLFDLRSYDEVTKSELTLEEASPELLKSVILRLMHYSSPAQAYHLYREVIKQTMKL
jgi:hypothetical protein